MATSEFLTRRLSHASVQSSNNVGMTEHLNNADPHPQYLKIDDYAGGNGIIDLSGYVTVNTFNSHVTDFDNFVNVTYTTWKTNIDGWKSSISNWKTDIDPLVSSISNWKNNTVDPAVLKVGVHETSINEINEQIASHLIQYPQNQNGVIPIHVDSSGNELFARRLHNHNLSDLDLSGLDLSTLDLESLSNSYLKISDINHDRTTSTGIAVTALSTLFAPADHLHTEFLRKTDLATSGIYPESANLLFDEDGIIDAGDESLTLDLDTIVEQGIYNIRRAVSTQTIAHARQSNGILIVTTAMASNNGTGSTRRFIYQLYIEESGVVSIRTLHEDRVTDTEGLTSEVVSVARDWSIISAPNRICSTTWTEINGSYTMDCIIYDICNVTLTGNCTLTLNGMINGRTSYLYVNNPNGKTLTYNNVDLISPSDTGKYRIEFQHNGIGTQCVGIMTIIE